MSLGDGHESWLGMRMNWRWVRRWGRECAGLSVRVRSAGDKGVVAVEVGD